MFYGSLRGFCPNARPVYGSVSAQLTSSSRPRREISLIKVSRATAQSLIDEGFCAPFMAFCTYNRRGEGS